MTCDLIWVKKKEAYYQTANPSAYDVKKKTTLLCQFMSSFKACEKSTSLGMFHGN